MADLLALSARYIDDEVYEGPASVNRITSELSEVADGVAVVEAFSHVWALRTADGLVLVDTSAAAFGESTRAAVRTWDDAPVDTIIYTHGHIDHVGGAHAWMAEADEFGRPRPKVVAHEAVPARFERYDRTNGYNAVVNGRQFGRGFGMQFPSDWVQPDELVGQQRTLDVGGLELDLRHAKGETDDHLWAWVPQHRAVLAGDFLTWVFPNAGNPAKVQRYPLEWAAALRAMAAERPALLLPAHGLPIDGEDRIAHVLDATATALESLVGQTLALMNAGARLDAIVHEVRVPDELMRLPWLQPVYDEPEFVVRNIWRLYGGWWDGNPAHLKPAPEAALAAELAGLAGGAEALAARGRELADAGELRLACHLVELAHQADPASAMVNDARREVYTARRGAELSQMAKGIFRSAADGR
jgi:alkyl sulfatase BDS1-like metallo-beta-lactamase superfamily hydrolase